MLNEKEQLRLELEKMEEGQKKSESYKTTEVDENVNVEETNRQNNFTEVALTDYV